MLRDKIVYIFLFVSLFSFGQQKSKMLLASQQQASGGSLGPNLFTTASAGNASNYANSTSGFQGIGATIAAIDNGDSTYWLEITTVDGTSDYGRLTDLVSSLSDGTNYRMDVEAYWTVQNASQAQAYLWDGDSPDITPVVFTNTPTRYEIDFTYSTGSFYARFYPALSTAGDPAIGNKLRIRIYSVKEIL